MLKMLIGAVALTALTAGAAMAGEPGPRPPYATGVWLGLGFGDGSCGFTLAGAHGDVTLLGVTLGGGAKLGFGGHCREDARAPVAYAPEPLPAPQPYARQPYPSLSYAPQGYDQSSHGYVYSGGGYYQPQPEPQPQGYVYSGGGYAQPQPYPAPAPCGCQQPPIYRAY